MKRKDFIERYIGKKGKRNWELKSKNDEELVFEKAKSKDETGTKYLKDDIYRIIAILPAILVFTFQAYTIYTQFLTDTLSSIIMLALFVGVIMAVLCLFIEMIESIYSCNKFKIDNSNEKSIYRIPMKQVKIKDRILTIEMTLLMMVVLLPSVLVSIFDYDGYVTMENYEIPIKLTDIDKDSKGKYENELTRSKSFLGEKIKLEQSIYDENEEIDEDMYRDAEAYMYINIFTSDHDWVLEKGFESIYRKVDVFFDIEEITQGKEFRCWNANKLYTTYFNERIIVYDNMIIDVYGDMDFNKENIEKILKTCEFLK